MPVLPVLPRLPARSLGTRLSTLLLVLYCLCNSPAVARSSDCVAPVAGVRAVPVALAGDLVIGTQNLYRLFDDRDDRGRPARDVSPALYRARLEALSRHIIEVLRLPHVLAVQEVEGEAVLAALAGEIAARSGVRYRALAPEGNDRGGIDVGYLVRTDWAVLGVEQLFDSERQGRARLFDRPPLRLRLRAPNGEALELVNVHLKSLRGSEKGAAEARRIATKRRAQAAVLAGWLRERDLSRDATRLVLLGDFNATPAGLGGVDVLGTLEATGVANALAHLPAGERYTYVYRCRGEALDHVLLSPALQGRVRAVAVSRGNAGVARDREVVTDARGSSDHDGLVVYLRRE